MKRTLIAAAVASVLLSPATSISQVASDTSSIAARGEKFHDQQVQDVVQILLDHFGSSLAAVGRVDSVLGNGNLQVLGQTVVLEGLQEFSVGDYIAVLGRPAAKGVISEASALRLRDPYVPGASTIFLRAVVETPISSIGRSSFGNQIVDVNDSLAGGLQSAWSEYTEAVEIVGTQPVPNGVVLARSLSDGSAVQVEGSLGTGKTDGSLGTGKTDGSLGTGKTDGSLGTGKTDGSLGTGKTDGSLGTDKTDGSLGTGKTDGSLGTGKTDGSLGTGKTDGSLGTGKTDGSLGTGKIDGSLGTGKAE